MKQKFTADFETSTWKDDETWVWAWAICDIETENITIGNDIDSFIEFCKSSKNAEFLFHNLKFDGEFLISWALNHGFKHVTKENRGNNTFTTLISNFGQFYEITFYYKYKNRNVHKTVFRDSLKIIPFSVNETAKAFNLPISKLKIDYLAEREIGHKLTLEEEEYIKNDVLIMAKALKIIFNENLTKMTRASNALHDYKSMMSASKFEHCFPTFDKIVDSNCRLSYKGGFTYLNPIYKDKIVKNGEVLDVNSLYPSVMNECIFPIGDAIEFEGEYEKDIVYPLYIQKISCSFELKKNKIPTIQIKDKISMFNANEYLRSSNNEIVTLCLTNIDLELFKEQYDIYEVQYEGGYKFKGVKGLFTNYIEKWIERKNQATICGNKGQRTLAKLMLNSLYGKFGTSLEAISKAPYLDENGIVHYKNLDKEDKKGLYIPIACFVTAYARNKTIRTAQSITDYSIKKYGKDMFIYSDTDSIHTLLSIKELEMFCDIDDVELGKWAHEAHFTKAKFVRQKCYIEEIENNNKITCAGMSDKCYKNVNFSNFKEGNSFDGNLKMIHVKGGIILKETPFTIKSSIKPTLKKKTKIERG